MRFRWSVLFVLVVLLSSFRLSGQATAPQVQQNIPGTIPMTVPKVGLGQERPGDYEPRGVFCGRSEISVRLDAAKETLALLMDAEGLKKLLDYEDTKYGTTDSSQKLSHRVETLKSVIKQRLGAGQ